MPLSKAALERLIEASPDIVVATDHDGTVAYYNDGAQEILGYARDEIIGQLVVRLYPSIDEARRVMAAMRSEENGGVGRVVNFPTRFVHKDAHEIPVAISGVILRDDSDEEQGTIGFAKDLTEIIRKDQMALLGEVAIGLSHEINNPLSVITNQLTLLERFVDKIAEPHEPEQGRNRIKTIKHEVKRIEENLQRLYEMAQGERYSSTAYLDDAKMIDLSRVPRGEERALKGRRVLVVDDDEAVRLSVVEILSNEGCQVESAAEGREALARLADVTFDVVLSDVVMPGMDGYELFRQVRRLHPDTHVVLMTAFYYDKDHVIKRSRLKGLEGVIFKKPVDPERLRESLAALLSSPPPAPSSH